MRIANSSLLPTLLWVLPVANVAGKTPPAVPLIVTNQCRDTIWPGIFTQNGTGPEILGFELLTDSTKTLSVLANWTGRIWGRTNCTFDSHGVGTCGTGDCAGKLACITTGAAATLAEFNLPGHANESYYDISLVDGYNLPIAIQAMSSNDVVSPSPNVTNPACIGSVEDFAAVTFNPYASSRSFLGTNSSAPLPFDMKTTYRDVSTWCPSDLQLQPIKNGRPAFDPCLSACSKTNKAEYCCTGKYNKPKKCGPNYYSKSAKQICPDAYSYAFDDASSTFTVPTGSGFEVIFCPGGRSTTIKQTLAKQAGISSATSGSANMLGAWIALLIVVLIANLG